MSGKPHDPRAGRYATIAIALHWTLAALIVLQVVLAGRMEGRTPEAFAVMQLHKSVGITVLLLSLARLAWRLVNPPPPEPATLARWERLASQAVHWAFYVVMIGMPITGWIAVSASRFAFPTLLFGVVPWPHLPGLADLAPAAREVWREVGETSHGLIVKGFYGLIALHVMGALKHQVLDAETPVLSRMAPGARAGRWLEPRLLIILAVFAGVVALGRLYQPPRLQVATAPLPVEVSVEASVAPPAPRVAPLVVAPPVSTEPGVWKVERGSGLTFSTTWGGEAIRGRFDRWTADIVFSPEALERSRVVVSIDMVSVNSGDAQRDASLPAADWFDAAVHPKATFTATRFDKVGEGRFVARGKLNLRGVSRPLDLPFRLKIDGDRAQVSGVTSLDRTTFGVGQGEWASTDQIPARVTVRVSLKARRN